MMIKSSGRTCEFVELSLLGEELSHNFSLIYAMRVRLCHPVSSMRHWPPNRQDFVFDSIRIAFSYPILTKAKGASMKQDERPASE